MVQTKSKLFGNYATSIPFFNYGGLLTSSLEAETLLLREAENFASKKWSFLISVTPNQET